jgi:hypothetical protein
VRGASLHRVFTRTSGVHEVVAHGEDGRRGARRDADLAVDALHVAVGGLGDDEVGGDLLDRAPAGQQGETSISRAVRPATCFGTWELPVIGAVTDPTAVLIRPDGYVAWAGDGTDLRLSDALTTWFGPPTST